MAGVIEVLVPTPLQSYTGGRSRVAACGDTLGALLADIERQCPGFRFRMIDEQGRVRRNMRIFVNGRGVFDLALPLGDGDDVAIVQALSGG